MYPHERSLVKRLADKPFVLIGINSDADRTELKKAMEKENITWRSWWDGGSTNGPIAKKWNVHSWPTIYVLDDKGIIRFKNVRGESMDKAVDELMKELESAPKK
jgi:peroxiredoxin